MSKFNVIYSFVKDTLVAFDNANFSASKVFWTMTRQNRPAMPICELSALIDQNVVDRTEHGNVTYTRTISTGVTQNYSLSKERRELIVTMSLQHITQKASTTFNAQADKNYIYNACDYLYSKLKTLDALYYFQTNGIIIKEETISNIRDLSEEEDTSYNFKYEFDISFGYNKTTERIVYEGTKVDLTINDINEEITEDA